VGKIIFFSIFFLSFGDVNSTKRKAGVRVFHRFTLLEGKKKIRKDDFTPYVEGT